MTMACPCQSGQAYADCCEPVHRGAAASSPEVLMRSRYSAFVLGLDDYIQRSWHVSTRPPVAGSQGEQWKRLEVLAADEAGEQGAVRFRATGIEQGRWFCLEETSRFVRENGHWYYLDGDCRTMCLDPGRNDPCPCGSARKFKKCCG